MFSKNFKFKASNSLKASYRKTLVQKIQATYPIVTEDDLREIVPPKASITAVKLVTSADENVTVFTVDNVPCAVEIAEILYPTVHALWRCPRMLKSITLESHLAGKLQDGILHVRRSHLPAFGGKLPRFSKGDPLSVDTVDNEAPVLVGIAQYSSDDMLIVQTGICIRTINIAGDLLCCNERFTKVDRPQLKPPGFATFEKKCDNVSNSLSQLTITDKNTTPHDNGHNLEKISPDDCDTLEEPVNEELSFATDDNSASNLLDETTDVPKIPDDMDGLLKYCLLCILKVQGKNIELPLKTNLLYANYMQSYCPSDKTLDIKKSSYKKLSKFLDAMQQEGFIQIREIEKGVDAIISTNIGHDLIREHVIFTSETPSQEKNDESTFKVPTIVEVSKITSIVIPLFASSGLKKGQTLSQSEVRRILVDYVKRNNLQNQQNRNMVTIDPFLGTIIRGTEATWEDLMTAILGRMTTCSEIRHPDGKSRLLTGKLKPITMQVANRSGNKKVTIVSNLEEYGLSLTALSKEWQHGVAASCTITKTPGSKTDQLVIQGDQTYFIAKHLTQVYGMPKKYVEGAEKILSKKKK